MKSVRIKKQLVTDLVILDSIFYFSPIDLTQDLVIKKIIHGLDKLDNTSPGVDKYLHSAEVSQILRYVFVDFFSNLKLFPNSAEI